ncbi:MAG TPA: hypothetical protein VFZ21_10135, partial [Gemmatimonadaceae bacterium]|nr:hypothetical protein [Gemmatimonadaceae bacterium]
MSALRTSHAVWLMRRAAVLDGASADSSRDLLDPARAAVLHRIAARVTAAAESGAALALDAAERAVLVAEVEALTDQAARESARTDARDLRRAEELL